MGFSQALSGLNAASSQLDVVGNNIANSQTVGFKGSSVQFADVYAAKTGLGTRVSAVLQDFSNGALESSGRNLDLAIAGGGFFRMTQNDQVVYSRNGQLTMTPDGYLENAQGARLTGYPAGVGAGGQPQALQVPAAALEAKATTGVNASLNLDANSSSNPADQTQHASGNFSYNYANSSTVYDSLGNRHNVTMYFAKLEPDATANPPIGDNDWQVRTSIDGTLTGGDGQPQPLTFDSNGQLTGSDTLTYTFTHANGATNPQGVAFDFGGTTQYGNDFELSSLNQDGYTSGSMVGITIDDAGNVIGSYSNEESKVLGTIALANFRNPEGLKPVGDNAWVETTASGQALVGLAGSGMLGSIESGTVETSNVDLTKELVDLIIAQRNFQANSQTIKTQDEVMQGIVNL
ncbi:flagellar hook protein FlgE [Modicisalibacter luteus]|uniref:Flagellar hook protein FlgE n=1 Tax=Modicisalibacter luteus TaxID=453962 RepID=A0ABV7M4C0_9GAMM|nr:flagellar hook protein FlgE [Halomonas lutea]GHA84221.1 flagellar hook protein FlgE [Halomonas lutea]